MDIIFVVMPFADLGRPAIRVSLLKAAALQAGYSARIEYCSIQLADRLGRNSINKSHPHFLRTWSWVRWFFARSFAGKSARPINTSVDHWREMLTEEFANQSFKGHESFHNPWMTARRKRRTLLGRRFYNHIPSNLRLARCYKRLKALPQPPIIVFGGANCEGEMGLQLLRSFPWIDFVCCGESDISFPKLLDHIFRGGSMVPGILEQGKSTSVAGQTQFRTSTRCLTRTSTITSQHSTALK